MKNTGIVRHLDNLGRITLPMSLRKSRGIKPNDAIEIWVDEDGCIVLKKYELAENESK